MSLFAILIRLIYEGGPEVEWTVNAIGCFERDLLDCGVPASEVQRLGIRYARALETCSHIDWIELYVGLFATLRRNLNTTRKANCEALERLLLLINDDLGSQLFAEESRKELGGGDYISLAPAFLDG